MALLVGVAHRQSNRPADLRPDAKYLILGGAPGPTRTGGLRFRKPLLYPAELRAQDEACRTRVASMRLSHRPRGRRARSVSDQAEDLALQLVASLEEGQLQQKSVAGELRSELSHQSARGRRGAPGRDDVVHHQRALARPQRVVVDLQAVGAVLQVVGMGDLARRQLALLADRDEAGAQAVGEHGAENETAALDGHDLV